MQKFIIAICAMLLILAFDTRSPKGQKENGKNIADNNQPENKISKKNDFKFKTYTNEAFNIQVKYPRHWKIVENLNGNFPEINFFDSQYENILELPINIHAPAEATFVSIFPKGCGIDLPTGQSLILKESSLPFNINFNTNKQESVLFKLDNNESWGYFLVMQDYPPSWQDGFIFAQVSTNDFSASCYEEKSSDEISIEDCNPMTGDRLVRSGEIDQQSMMEVKAILESFHFEREENEKLKVTEMIEIEKPLPNQDIRSPLTIKGKARGMWYFEGDFPVALVDKDGNTIAEAIATAQGKWMTEDFVPFSATVRYDNAPDDERGYLVFHRDNPSGLPEHDMQYRQPVLFPPK